MITMLLNFIKSRKIISIAVIIIFLLIVTLGARRVSGGQGSSGSDPRVQIQPAKSEQDINRDFTFPLKDSTGKQVSDFKYTIQKAELRDEIVIKGQRAVAVSGRTFLLIYLKITNSENQSIQINTRDYIRLSVNGNKSEWLAADVHNDPVAVQAISTKYTTVGFAINDTDKNLVLSVGEIGGDKTEIELQKL